MGTTKTENFTQQQLRLAQLAKAIGHPARIAILEFLIAKQTCICGDIVEELPLSQATVSQHLKELKEAGIIQGEISGVKTCYCINPDVWQEVKLVFNALFSTYTGSNCC
ncbi:MAG: ArsR/SmtB family transcription factor [Bacteroidia bacterium]